MKVRNIRTVSVMLILSLLISSVASGVFYAAEEPKESINLSVSDDENSYAAYLKENGHLERAESAIDVPLEGFTSVGADVSYADSALLWNDGNGEVSFELNTENAGLYNVKLVWSPMSTGVDLSLGLKIDGEYPFADAAELVLNREWKNATEDPRCDAQGNEYAQEQVEVGTPITTYLYDDTGVAVEPYMFAFEAGIHKITLVYPEQALTLFSVELCPPEKTEKYEKVSKQYRVKDLDADIITVQGEDAAVKSTDSIIPKSNNSDSSMTPMDPYKTRINYIGSTAWQATGEKLTWKFTAEKSGYYYIALRYKQADLINGKSLRWLKIDGKTPFEEAKNISFPYGTGWEYMTLSDDASNPYYVWLDKGEHTLSMEVTMGQQSEFFDRLSKIVDVLGDEYIKIIMITGESPDINRDYELFNQIPDFTETLTQCRDALDSLAADMKAASGSKGTQAIAAMENMSRVLNNMLKSPYIAQQYVSNYYSNYTSVSSWLYDMTKMPLSVDEIQIVPAGKEYNDKTAGIFRRVYHWAVRIIASFISDYSLTDNDGKDEKTIRLWVGWGQDQASVLNSLINDSFTPETGIKVDLEVVNASLINGMLSGNFPDMVLHMSRTDPVNLGMRGALADLRQFDDLDTVLTRFKEGAEIPYSYKDKLYALPDTQSYFLMFYRTDVFDDLGLQVPKTWDEFIHTSTIIQRNNMSVYVPYTQIVSTTTVNAGIGNLHLFPTLMYQRGLNLYNDTLDGTALTSKAAADVFKYWTEFYTDYNFYKEADFYNRFRVGVMPLGIATHATYLTLCSAAPEIKGRWAIATVPGTADQNGVINRTVSGGGTGCGIVEKSTKKAEAWEFLKWWTSDKIQARYSNNVESILGTISRVATSNVAAFKSLSWDRSDLEVFMEQWENVIEIPEVPGSYYLTRAIDQAYWAVINGESTTKDAIVKWSKSADEEIVRKIKEYS